MCYFGDEAGKDRDGTDDMIMPGGEIKAMGKTQITDTLEYSSVIR